ncbi:MAG: hypothetical protein ACF8GE_08230 [Phycisphaerales bacterium JB043]
MNTTSIFTLQFMLSIVVWGVVLQTTLIPHLNRATRSQKLFWLTLPHAFRHIGLAFLVPSLNAGALDAGFATSAAYGDLAAGSLALLALLALKANLKGTIPLVWTFNTVGTIDLLYALSHERVIEEFGATWFIPTFLVPLLLVTHAHIFITLVRRTAGSTNHTRQRGNHTPLSPPLQA